MVTKKKLYIDQNNKLNEEEAYDARLYFFQIIHEEDS